MAITPKKFVADRDFTYRGITYRKGDPVTDRRTIDRLAGGSFLRHTKSKTATAETEADLTDAATTQTTVSTKEDS